MTKKREIRFSFDYNCSPIWLSGDNCGDWLISSQGYFYQDLKDKNGQKIDHKVPEDLLKGENELEKKVNQIYEIHSKIFDINNFPNGEPYLGFTDKKEENCFFDACDFVINRMKEIFGDDFIVNERDEKIIKERGKLFC